MSVAQELVVTLLSGLSAFIAGLLGAGGDILYVPLLLYGLPAIAGDGLPVHTVTALSLVGSLASTASGGLEHHRAGRVDRTALFPACAALGAGALAGGLLSRAISSSTLLVAFAIVTTAAAFILLVPPGTEAAPARRRDPLAAGLLAASGLLCGAVGVGGGFLIITVLLHRARLPMQIARGTGLALTFFTAAPALAGKAATGQLLWQAVPFIVVSGLVGAVAGSRAGAGLSSRGLRFALASLVVVLSVRVWATVLSGAPA